MMTWKKALMIPIFFLGIGIWPLFALGQSASPSSSPEIEALNKKIDERKAKVKQLEESIEQVKKDIAKKQLEAVSLKNQMAIIDNRITQVELDVEVTQKKLETLELEIQALDLTIKEKETEIVRQKEMIGELIRELYYQDGKTAVEILAAYDTFSEFYNQLQYLETLEQELAQSAHMVKLAKIELEEKRQQTTDRKESYEELEDKLIERKRDLDEQLFSKQNVLAQTKSSELTYKTLLTNLRKQYQDIENEITSIESEVRKKLEEQSKIDDTFDQGEGELSWPTNSRYITAYFHDPDYPFRNVFEHSGLDIRASQGTTVRATGSGYIARAKRCSVGSCYSYVLMVHSGGLSTLYGHLSQISVTEDQFVTKGDVIGYSGGTPGTPGAGPFVTGPHLHFEVRKNGIPVNPLPYLKGE